MGGITMEELKMIEEKGLQDVEVFQVCESEAVAAYSLDEAISYYKDLTGLEDDELYPYEEIEVVPMDRYVRNSEDDDAEMITVQEIVNQYWNGKPFVAVTTD
jgi:hypothetical protein